MSDIKNRNETGLGPNKYGVMECSECDCRAFQIISLKDNESFIRRGKRKTEYRCLNCGEAHNSIASNLYDLGEYGWRQIPSGGLILDRTEINEANWLKWHSLNQLIRWYVRDHKRMQKYGSLVDSMLELDID